MYHSSFLVFPFSVANVCIRFYLNAYYVARYVSEAHNSPSNVGWNPKADRPLPLTLSRSPSYVMVADSTCICYPVNNNNASPYVYLLHKGGDYYTFFQVPRYLRIHKILHYYVVYVGSISFSSSFLLTYLVHTSSYYYFLLFSSLFFFLLSGPVRNGRLAAKIGQWWRCIILNSQGGKGTGKR